MGCTYLRLNKTYKIITGKGTLLQWDRFLESAPRVVTMVLEN